MLAASSPVPNSSPSRPELWMKQATSDQQRQLNYSDLAAFNALATRLSNLLSVS
jgi:hypothetical protein